MVLSNNIPALARPNVPRRLELDDSTSWDIFNQYAEGREDLSDDDRAPRVSSHWSPYDNGPTSPFGSSAYRSSGKVKTAGFIPKTLPLTPQAWAHKTRRSRDDTHINDENHQSAEPSAGRRLLTKAQDSATKSKRAVKEMITHLTPTKSGEGNGPASSHHWHISNPVSQSSTLNIPMTARERPMRLHREKPRGHQRGRSGSTGRWEAPLPPVPSLPQLSPNSACRPLSSPPSILPDRRY